MFTHPGRLGQLACEHHHQMLAQASRRRLRHQHSRPAATTGIIRRLAALIAGAGVVPAQGRASPGPPGRTRPANQPAGLRFQAAATNGKAAPSTRAAVSKRRIVAPSPRTAGGQQPRHLEKARMPVMCRTFC